MCSRPCKDVPNHGFHALASSTARASVGVDGVLLMLRGGICASHFKVAYWSQAKHDVLGRGVHEYDLARE
jgi:hypothetical protein